MLMLVFLHILVQQTNQCKGRKVSALHTHLLNFVDDEVAFVAQDCGCVSVLLREQIEPLGHSVHHGQDNGPQEAQDVQDLLHHLSMHCSTQQIAQGRVLARMVLANSMSMSSLFYIALLKTD